MHKHLKMRSNSQISYVNDCTHPIQLQVCNYNSWTYFHLLKLQTRLKPSLGAPNSPLEDLLFLY